MPARHREEETRRSGTYQTRLANPVSTSSLLNFERSCDDVTGNPFGDNPLDSVKRRVTGAICNGGPATTTQGSLTDCPASNFTTRLPVPKFAQFDKTANDEINRAIAMSNPSRPDVLLPAFIGELGDIPRMLKYGVEVGKFLSSPDFRRQVTGSHRFKKDYMDAGNLVHYIKPTRGNAINAARQVAIANLSLQFGFLPFFGDIAKLLTLQDGIESRRKELNKLFSSNGLRRNVRLAAVSEQKVEPFNANTTVATASVQLSQMRVSERWASIRWKPASRTTLPPSDDTIRQNMLGFNLQSVGSTAWELLPWSWMADYFGNVGHTLAALNNSMGTAPPKGCVMTHSRETLAFPGTIFGNLGRFQISSGKRIIVSKQRTVFTGVQLPTFGIPILGSRQLSILGSIFTTRAFR